MNEIDFSRNMFIYPPMHLNHINQNIFNPEFAYFMGTFAGNGSFYFSGRSTRFELCDGIAVEEDLKFSKEFLISVKRILEEKLKGQIKEPKRKGNQYILKFRSKKLSEVMQKEFSIFPGHKTYTIDIPKIYLNHPLIEKEFWLGVMDTDGMVARNSRKISLWSASNNLINSFKKFLSKNNLIFSEKERFMNGKKYFGVEVKSPFFKKYTEILGFKHPRKNLWLKRHLKNRSYLNYDLVINNFITKEGNFDFEKIFNTSNIYIIEGKELLKNYGIKRRGNMNVPFLVLLKSLKPKIGMEDFYKIVSRHKWKMSKGSTEYVKLPIKPNKNFLRYAKFVRLTSGGIRLSRNYIKAFNENVDEVTEFFIQTFDIHPKFTSKGEILFCSGVLNKLFSKVLVKNK